MPSGIRALIFDLDGVITDTAEFHYRSWKRLADEEGIPFTREDNEALRGVSRRESLNRMLKGRSIDEETAQAWMTRKNEYYLAHLDELTPAHRLPGVTRLLEDARHIGLRLGLGSASKNARSVLEKLALLDAFDALGDGFSVVNPKPAVDLFVWVAGRLAVYPQQAIVFEDAEAGIEAARNGGFWTVGIGTATRGLADVHYDTMADVKLAEVLSKVGDG
ncbi:MAG: beta-phosphoglucomutase [Anaerolineae bacterium]|nr:beta-phosphoglucomutase [Anaerolineae bacterium]